MKENKIMYKLLKKEMLKKGLEVKDYKRYSLKNVNISAEYLVLSHTRYELIEIQKEIDKIEEYNNKVEENNNELLAICKKIIELAKNNTVVNILSNTEISSEDIVDGIGKIINDIKSKVRTKINCKKVIFNESVKDAIFTKELANLTFSGDNLVDIFDKMSNYLFDYNRKNEKKYRNNKLNQVYVLNLYKTKYSNSSSINNKVLLNGIDGKDVIDVLVDIITENEKEEYYNKYIKGEEFKIGNCDKCGKWIGGDDHCVCGNVKLSYTMEGDLASGFYADVKTVD